MRRLESISAISPNAQNCPPKTLNRVQRSSTAYLTQRQWPSAGTRRRELVDLHAAFGVGHRSRCVPPPQGNKPRPPFGARVHTSRAPCAIISLHGIAAHSRRRRNSTRVAFFCPPTVTSPAPTARSIRATMRSAIGGGGKVHQRAVRDHFASRHRRRTHAVATTPPVWHSSAHPQ